MALEFEVEKFRSTPGEKWRSTPGEKQRSTPGDEWEVEIGRHQVKKRRFNFPPTFPLQLPPKVPPNFHNCPTKFFKFRLILNLVIDQKRDH